MAFNWDAAKTKKDYAKLEKQDIFDYCKQHDKMEWLKQAAADLKKEEAAKNEKTIAQGKKPRKFGIIQLRAKFIAEVLKLDEAKPQTAPKSLYDEIMSMFENDAE